MIFQIERGWAGHFVGWRKCAFRRNTLVGNGRVRIVVSTVGSYWPTPDAPEEIGAGRFYETLAFYAMSGHCLDPADSNADHDREVGFGGEWCLDHIDEGTDTMANSIHDEAVRTISKMIARGDL